MNSKHCLKRLTPKCVGSFNLTGKKPVMREQQKQLWTLRNPNESNSEETQRDTFHKEQSTFSTPPKRLHISQLFTVLFDLKININSLSVILWLWFCQHLNLTYFQKGILANYGCPANLIGNPNIYKTQIIWINIHNKQSNHSQLSRNKVLDSWNVEGHTICQGHIRTKCIFWW